MSYKWNIVDIITVNHSFRRVLEEMSDNGGPFILTVVCVCVL